MKRVNATYDGEVFHPDEPVEIPPNTRVTLSVDEPAEEKTGEPYSFLKAVRAANLEGPPDWSERLDHYLYGVERNG
jgi:hypothetical protein